MRQSPAASRSNSEPTPRRSATRCVVTVVATLHRRRARPSTSSRDGHDRNVVVSTTSKKNFAPIPLRAVRDQRLTGHHLRVLAVIAAHDRLNKNGSGCWASQNRLAALLGCSKSRLSEGLSDLRDYGYIDSRLNPEKRWYRVHRVIYSIDDERFWPSKSVPRSEERRVGK